jgi:O-antigen/teichoic acid export membrane protein
MSYVKRALRGSLFVFIASMITAFLAYFVRIVLARQLSVEDYGLFFSVFAFVSFLLFFRDLGLGSALVKHLAEFKTKKKFDEIKTSILSVFFSLLFLSSIFGIILYFLAPFLAQNYFKDPRAEYVLYFFIAYILFSALFLFLKNIFQGFQKIKIFALMEPIRLGVILTGVLLLFESGYGFLTPIIAYTLSWLIVFILFLPFTWWTFSFFKYKIKNMRKITKQLYMFGIAIALAQIGAKVIARIDTLMLTYFNPLSDVGIYNVVLPTALLFLFFSEAISPVLYPLVSELWAKKDTKRLTEGIRLLYKYSFVITMPAFLTIFVFSTLAIKILFGVKYVSGSIALQILLIGVLFLLVSTINNTILAAIGRPGAVTKSFLVVAMLNIILNLLLIPLFGIEGAAISTLISYALLLIVSTLFVVRYIKIKIPLSDWIKTAFSGGVFLGIAFVLKKILVMNIWTELIITILVAGIVYLILACIFKLINIKELKFYLDKAIN